MSKSTIHLIAGFVGADEEPPRGRAAMGWRIAVFWKDDATFYEGKVTGYNCATGRHDVLYDDNETENLSLSSEKVIWRIPPNCLKNGRNAFRKKSVNNGKSRASSQSDFSGKVSNDCCYYDVERKFFNYC